MSNKEDSINQLLDRLENLLERQNSLSKDVTNLQNEIKKLQNSEVDKNTLSQHKKDITQVNNPSLGIGTGKSSSDFTFEKPTSKQKPPHDKNINKSDSIKSNIEKFIGENLTNKIGIAITIVGIAIGTKYSIEHNLITPLARVILGYLAGFMLLGVGLGLKKNYKNYSAVLVSGGIAVLYFITYVAYGFFGLIPQLMAFSLMVVFTIFAVLAALNYNRQIIAHIGLVGAYAIPFLLNEGSGKVALLFGYISIINLGVLAISFRKYWKPLYYSSFGLSWAIFLLWFVSEYSFDEHFGMALIYLIIFFVTFYIAFLAYKLIKKENFGLENVVLLLANSFVFYGIGYAILESHEMGRQILGLFTVLNGIVHSIVAVIIYKQKMTDRNLFHLVLGVALIFATIAIPVQLDGNWVTLLWAGEAALLFWIGRVKNTGFYEKLSCPLMLLAFSSIVHDWTIAYSGFVNGYPGTTLEPFFNITFFTSLLVIFSFGFINYINRDRNYPSSLNPVDGISKFILMSIPVIFFLTTYYTFRLEIANYFNILYSESTVQIRLEGGAASNFIRNDDLLKFKTIWIIVYSLLFVTVLSFINIWKLRERRLGLVNLGVSFFFVAVFLTQGLFVLSELRDSYLEQNQSQYYQIGIFNIGIRYVAFVFIAFLLVACHKYTRQDFIKWNLKITVDLLIHLTILWIMSSELINWMDIMEVGQPYKLGLSILWGLYSLLLIVLGIWKRKKHLRISAIILFGVTLIKLFVYDISNLGTISKTIAFVSLGILLLIISFLYNKYRQVLFGEPNDYKK